MSSLTQRQQSPQPDVPALDAPAPVASMFGWPDAALSPPMALSSQGLGGNSWVNALLGAPADPMCLANSPPGMTPAAPTATDPDQQIAHALAVANDRMATGLLDWAVTDQDATAAADALTSLPPELQGRAIEKLDPDTFDRLLSNMPDLDKERLAALVDNVQDPQRKLKLWAEAEKGKATREAQASLGDEGHWYWQTDAQAQNELANDEIMRNLEARKQSLDADVAAGLASKTLSAQDVSGIMANRIVSDLSALPPDKQGAAIAAMDPKSFERLLTDTPPADRERFKTLVDNTSDPERKLKLWAEYHKSKVSNEAGADRKDEGTGSNKTPDQLKNRDFNEQRRAIVETNNKEVDDEVSVAMKQLADGHLTEQSVQDLIARKNKEAEIERKYNINMSNDFGQVANGTTNPETERRTWSMAELEQVQGALDRMPPGQVTSNPALKEIRREKVRTDLQEDDTWQEDSDTGADAGDGLITVYDTGAGFDPATGTNQAADPWRTKKTSDLAGHRAGGAGKDAELSLIEEVITHEAGHTVHQGDAALWSEWLGISGWEKMDAAALKTRLKDSGLKSAAADKKIAGLEKTRDAHYSEQTTVNAGDKTYQVDPYSEDYLGLNQGAIPGSLPGSTSDDTEWGYAASNPEDHFAEVYAKAIHQPEALYADLVSGPAALLQSNEALLAAQTTKLEALRSGGASKERIKAAEAKLSALQSDVDRARAGARMNQAQWNFFRQKVFGADDKDIQALTAPPGKEAIYQEYKEKATMCQTPQQLDALRAAYMGLL